MDAAHTSHSKNALLLTVALLLAMPLAAQAQAFSFPNGSSIPVTAGGYNCLEVDSTAGQFSYNVAQVAPPAGVVDPAFAIYPPRPVTTGQLLCFSNFFPTSSETGGTRNISVTLTPTVGTVAAATITIVYSGVGTGGTGGNNSGGGLTANATSLSLTYTGGNVSPSVGLNLTNNTTADITVDNIAITYGSQGSGWLALDAVNGTVPATHYRTVTLTANPAGLTNQTYTATLVISYSGGAGSIVIPVSLTVNVNSSTSGSLTATPNPVNLNYISGSNNPPSALVTLTSVSGATTYGATTNGSTWLLVNGQSQFTDASISGGLRISTILSNLPTASANATITITDAVGNTLTLPVNFTVNGTSSGNLTFSPSPLTLSASVGQATSPTGQITVTSDTAGSLVVSSTSTGNWLTATLAGSSIVAGGSQTINISANPAGLSANTYQGTVTVTLNGTITGTATVSFAVGQSSNTGGNVTVSPTSLTFNYRSGDPVPLQSGFNVASVSTSGVSVSYTVAVSPQSAASWLSTNTTSTGFTPGVVTVIVNPAGLQAGNYSGTVTVSPTGGTAVPVPVSLVVQGVPTVSATPAAIPLTFQIGNANTPTGSIQVTGSSASLAFTATASSTGNWLAVTPASGNTGASGATLNVTVNPAGLTVGTYTGTIVVAGASGVAGSSTTTVTLTVAAPLPTIAALESAASGTAGPVSPGEIVSLFAPSSHPIGPATPAYLTLDSSGNVATTLGGVQVLFNGTPAPLTYVSASQINAVVPYNVAGFALPFVQVRYQGQSSNSFNINTTSTAPGIFTQTGTGTGAGAILNADNSTNGPNNPAAKGSVVVIYMTGEGATNPPGVTGKVNCPSGSACTIAQLPVPLLKVSVTLIDSTNTRYPADFIYAGAAPGFVSGVMQVNAVIPPNVPSGDLQLVVAVGGNTSQSGVTVSVK